MLLSLRSNHSRFEGVARTPAGRADTMRQLVYIGMDRHLTDFKGSQEEQRLAQESYQLVADIQLTIKQYLTISSQDVDLFDWLAPVRHDVKIANEIPKLFLELQTYFIHGERPENRVLIHDFCRLARHSNKLRAFPAVRAAFWKTLFNTTIRVNDVDCVLERWFIRPEFPRFTLNFGGKRCGGDKRWTTTDSALFDVVFEALATPHPDVDSMLSFDFGFRSSSMMEPLTLEQLQSIETLLDRIFACPQRSCSVRSLDLSRSAMHPSELGILARIVAKCRTGVYAIEELQLDAIIPHYGSPTYEPTDTPNEYLDITTAAFAASTLPRVADGKLPPACDATGSMLRKVALSKNHLTPNYFPSHFSTLRYGCSLEEDLTDYFPPGYTYLDKCDQMFATECWRWFAFGLLYPRPKRFADTYKLRTLGNLLCSPLAIRTIVNTLRNPVAQLVDNNDDDMSATDLLMVCTIKEGASIQVFVDGTGFDLIESPLYPRRSYPHPRQLRETTVLETSEFEALCERADGAVCVVVPGIGFGWVENAFVVRIEREPLDRSSLDGLYHITISIDERKGDVDDLRKLFQVIGRQLRSLTFDFVPERNTSCGQGEAFTEPSNGDSVAQIICDRCPHLQHLKLNCPSPRSVSDLITAMENTDLRSRLLTLNINDSNRNSHARRPNANNYFDDAIFARLSSLLADAANPPVLE